jgi:integrase/recombinase XerC
MAGAEGLRPSPAAGDLAEPVDAWRNWLKSERRAASLSLEAYERDLFAFLVFLAEYQGAPPSLQSLKDLGRGDLRAWLAARGGRGLKATSTARALSVIRGFFRFLARRGLVENAAVLALRNPKIPKSVPRALNEAEAMDALDNIGELEGEPWIAKRDTALLTLLYGCGLRLGEALSLTRADVKAARAGRLTVFALGAQDSLANVSRMLSRMLRSSAAA